MKRVLINQAYTVFIQPYSGCADVDLPLNGRLNDLILIVREGSLSDRCFIDYGGWRSEFDLHAEHYRFLIEYGKAPALIAPKNMRFWTLNDTPSGDGISFRKLQLQSDSDVLTKVDLFLSFWDYR